jgi:hypothetical protein
LQRRYARAKVKPVENDIERLSELGVKVVTGELVDDSAMGSRKVRHDPEALAQIVIDLASRSRAYQVRSQALMQRRRSR